MTDTATAAKLLALADQCVMCGLCLPHCPTYRLAEDEAESPRGRIAMARAIAHGGGDADPSLLRHLDQCLGCRSCESACPSGVAYDQILIHARALIEPQRPGRGLLRHLVHSPRAISLLAKLGNLTAAARWLPQLLQALPSASPWRRLAEALPPRRQRLPSDRRRRGPARSRIALLGGCVGSAFDADTIDATRRLLVGLGHDVVAVPDHLCCGALPRHAGAATSQAIEMRTRSTLLELAPDIVITAASGCHSSLAATMASTTLAVADAIRLIGDDPQLDQLRFRPLSARVALHLPCSQLNGTRSVSTLRKLLGMIPGLIVHELPAQPRCCGAAGSYFIEQAAISDPLRDQRVSQITAMTPDLVLTSNIGCRLQLEAGMRQSDCAAKVLHPLTLLAQQLEEP